MCLCQLPKRSKTLSKRLGWDGAASEHSSEGVLSQKEIQDKIPDSQPGGTARNAVTQVHYMSLLQQMEVPFAIATPPPRRPVTGVRLRRALLHHYSLVVKVVVLGHVGHKRLHLRQQKAILAQISHSPPQNVLRQ